MRDSAQKSDRKNAAPHHSLLRCGGLSGRWIHLLLILSVAMTTASAQQDASPAEGVENGNYNYQGSVELGYRFVNSNGSDVVYDTFVNQHQGPRIIEQTLNMRSRPSGTTVRQSLPEQLR